MRYEGNKVVISESEIHDLVNESVKIYLRENAEDEGFWGGVGTALKGMKKGNFYLGQNYRLGNQVTSFSKYAGQIANIGKKMQKIADANNLTQISNNLVSFITQIDLMAKSFQEQLNQQLKPQQYNMQGANNYENYLQNNPNYKMPMQYTQPQPGVTPQAGN